MNASQFKNILNKLEYSRRSLDCNNPSDLIVINSINDTIRIMKEQRDLHNPWESIVMMNKIQEQGLDGSITLREVAKKEFIVCKRFPDNIGIKSLQSLEPILAEINGHFKGILEAVQLRYSYFNRKNFTHEGFSFSLFVQTSLKSLQKESQQEDIYSCCENFKEALSDNFVLRCLMVNNDK